MRMLDRAELVSMLAAVATGLAGVLLLAGTSVRSETADLDRLRASFARPSGVPHPADNPATPARIALGERLFTDPRLSADGRISCATCHDAKLGFADGTPLSTAGSTGRPLRRHTPSLWNVAWAPLLMWDGRAGSLEAQAALPMSDADEMAHSPELGAVRLAGDPDMRAAFASAFPERPAVDAANLLKALAIYQRTLVSPPTRFDQWVAGAEDALSSVERLGLDVFVGKAGCISCHVGFAFTDHAFHDVGLPTADPGRGPVAGLRAAEHAFKTPTLRELAWTAPYMHNGSLATLDEVVRHYEGGGIARPSRSREMPKPFSLSEEERTGLIAFLEALSSDDPPRPSQEEWVRRDAPRADTAMSIGTTVISQRGRVFMPGAVKVRRGEALVVLNDDKRTHNVRIASPLFDYNSGAQEPGESINLRFDHAGTYEAHCGIHPTMRLTIAVE
jgi:cytochrome c peroxidase